MASDLNSVTSIMWTWCWHRRLVYILCHGRPWSTTGRLLSENSTYKTWSWLMTMVISNSGKYAISSRQHWKGPTRTKRLARVTTMIKGEVYGYTNKNTFKVGDFPQFLEDCSQCQWRRLEHYLLGAATFFGDNSKIPRFVKVVLDWSHWTAGGLDYRFNQDHITNAWKRKYEKIE